MRSSIIGVVLLAAGSMAFSGCNKVNRYYSVPNSPQGVVLQKNQPAGAEAPDVVLTSDIAIVWNDLSGNEERFTIERKLGDGRWEKLAQVDADVTTYLDVGVPSAASVCYRVTADNVYGSSPVSGEACVSGTEPIAFPDLRIASIDSVSPDCPAEGDCRMKVAFTVTNDGTKDVEGAIGVRAVFAEGISADGIVNGLKVNESKSAILESAGGFRCIGECQVCVTLDPDGLIDESNEDNNTTCAPFQTPLPDLVVTSVEVDEEYGEVIVTVANLGLRKAEGTIPVEAVHNWFYEGYGPEIEPQTIEEGLGPDESKTLRMAVNYDGNPFHDTFAILATVNGNREVEESIYWNNSLCQGFGTELQIVPGDWQWQCSEGCRRTFSTTLTITNTGYRDAVDVRIWAGWDKEAAIVAEFYYIPADLEERIYQVNVEAPCSEENPPQYLWPEILSTDCGWHPVPN